MRERLHHLALIDGAEPPGPAEFSRWADTRLDRWIVDWCLRTGKEQTAKEIAKEKRIEVGQGVVSFTMGSNSGPDAR